MPRPSRAEQFDPANVCILHVTKRCVRRAYLAGVDPISGKDFSVRREWIRARMERLASVFSVDVLTYAILSNHLHLILRTRPDIANTWSKKEVAIRWLRMFPGRRIEEYLCEPTTNDVSVLASNEELIASIRLRLSNPSWFIKALCEPIARMANRQDEVTGHFWEGRFKAQTITDEAGLLACSLYVDLNPVRAALAATLEDSIHTSAYDRTRAFQGETIYSAAAEMSPVSTDEASRQRRTKSVETQRKDVKDGKRKRRPQIARDAWLAPLTIESQEPSGPHGSKSGVRASDKGYLSITLPDYLTLLDWVSRQRAGALGKVVVPPEMEPILDRIGLNGNMMAHFVWDYKKYFGRSTCAGKPANMQQTATNNNRSYTHGQKKAAILFR
jgi:REP element-mobilizing transposase RayT